MSLQTLSSDILLEVWSFLKSNNDSCSLVKTCKSICIIGKLHGYIKDVSLKYNINVMDFIQRCCDHTNSIETIIIEDMTDPTPWIPIEWPKHIRFDRCEFIDPISPRYADKTEVLYIYDNYRSKNKRMIIINWGKFPNLKKLYIYAYNIDIGGISLCQKLEELKIDILSRDLLDSQIKNTLPLLKICTYQNT